MPLSLGSSVSQLHGVGPAVAQRLATLELRYVFELLFHYPKRHEDYSHITEISDCAVGTPVTICGQITSIRKRQSWKRRRFSLTEATIHDESDSIKIIWFNQPFIAEQLKIGDKIFVSGKIVQDKYGQHMNNPVYERFKIDTIHTARIVPMYSTTYGLTQKQLRYFIKQALIIMENDGPGLPDWLPDHIRKEYDLLSLPKALYGIHFPDSLETIQAAKLRIGFDELLIVQLFIQQTRNTLARERAESIPFQQKPIQNFVEQLPFKLTSAQKRAAWQIIQDCEAVTAMNRLLEGDVGSGKTVVAALAMYNASLSGFQSVLMAPTEVLAQQHFNTISSLLRNTHITVGLITANHKTNAGAALLVGTHALLYGEKQFTRLGLVIVDEQHRFGVKHRQALREHSGDAGTLPHLLSMTATPIPRSLALTIYGDLALSLLDTLPAGRQPIQTSLVSTPAQRKTMYVHIEERLSHHEQVYVVAPRIAEDTEVDEESKASVEKLYKIFTKRFPKAEIAQLHGQLKSVEKQDIMRKFSEGAIDMLIATTIIEVGVNVPNATVMVIEQADRFGLAQLHQLRGRVGRSDISSYCYVCTSLDPERANERLNYFVNTTSGFALAEYDLELRGPGDVYGHEQSGFLDHFKIAKLSDQVLVAHTQTAAKLILADIDKYPLVQQRLDQFVKRVHLE